MTTEQGRGLAKDTPITYFNYRALFPNLRKRPINARQADNLSGLRTQKFILFFLPIVKLQLFESRRKFMKRVMLM